MKYTCPMHPEIRRDEPGICPICGMDLEPVVGLGENGEYAKWAKRFWIALIFSLPVVVLSMMGYPWVQLLLTTVVVFGAGGNLYERAWVSVVNRHLNMFTLIGLGTGVAYVFSVVGCVFPEIFPDSMRVGRQVPLYFESAAVIITLVLLGQMLEARARGKTGAALSALIKESPKRALRVDSDGEHEVSIEAIKVGDHLRVLAGEKVPVDGLVVEGESHVDEAIITGEGIPVKRKEGDRVIGGTLNQEGSFIMVAEKVGAETLFAQIVEMVAQAQRTVPAIQRVADRVSEYFVPTVLGIALLTFMVWGVWGPEPRWIHGLVYAVSVLIIACPCALGLATPVSIIVGVGRGAQMGILIKNAEALERLSQVTVLVVDKTGTLTEGLPGVSEIVVKAGLGEDKVLQLVASVEQGSEHPIARAVLREAKRRYVGLLSMGEFESITGKGVRGKIEGREVAVGNLGMMQEFNIEVPKEFEGMAERWESEAKTVLYVTDEQGVIGILAVGDLIKATSLEAIRELHNMGLKIVMLTGDNEGVARAVAGELGIDGYYWGMNPVEKGLWIEKLKAEGEVVAMAGDGVNDAVSLAKADVGIAMGTGAGVALESAGVTLIKGDLREIRRGIYLSRLTLRNIWQNLFFAFIYNCVGIPIAAGVLYPLWGIALTPMIAGVAMSLSSVSVLLNALRLRKMRIE